eukprot:1499436-Pyramimonas_sp.AAC.1
MACLSRLVFSSCLEHRCPRTGLVPSRLSSLASPPPPAVRRQKPLPLGGLRTTSGLQIPKRLIRGPTGFRSDSRSRRLPPP